MTADLFAAKTTGGSRARVPFGGGFTIGWAAYFVALLAIGITMTLIRRRRTWANAPAGVDGVATG